MLWVFYALLHSLFRAAYAETNRVFRANPWHLAFWQAVFACAVLLPLIPVMAWPLDGRFYFAAVVVALIITVGTLIQLTLASRQSGRVSSIYMPLEAIAAFLIWIAAMPVVYYYHADNLGVTLAVLGAFVLATIGILKIRSQDITLQTFSIVAPIGITYAVAGVVTKLVMPEQDVLPAAMAFVLINYLVAVFVLGLVLVVKKKISKEMTNRRLIRAGVITGIFTTIAYTTFVGSVALAPNPGYVSLIAMLLPVWMIVFHKLVGAEDTSHRGAALMLVGAVALLIAAVHYL